MHMDKAELIDTARKHLYEKLQTSSCNANTKYPVKFTQGLMGTCCQLG